MVRKITIPNFLRLLILNLKRGKYFFSISPNYLTKLRVYWKMNQKKITIPSYKNCQLLYNYDLRLLIRIIYIFGLYFLFLCLILNYISIVYKI